MSKDNQHGGDRGGGSSWASAPSVPAPIYPNINKRALEKENRDKNLLVFNHWGKCKGLFSPPRPLVVVAVVAAVAVVLLLVLVLVVLVLSTP